MPRMKTAADRVWKWDLKYTSENVAKMIDKTKGVMLEHVTSTFNDLVRYEMATKTMLNSQPVSVTEIAPYLCFSRELWKVSKKYAGQLLARECNARVEKWAARNLRRDVLWAIAFEVYTVRPPIAQPEA